MNPYEIKIIEAARKIESLEKEYRRLMYESKTPQNKDELWEYGKKLWLIGSEAFDLKNEIVTEYPNIADLKINDPSVKNTLDKIRSNDTFYSISFYETYSEFLEEKSEKPFDFAFTFEQFLETKYDTWHDEFYQRFHLIRNYHAIIRIGPIISSSNIPGKARSYFNEIREAFALELYASCIALCRAAMEMCLFDKLQKKGYFKETKIVKFDPSREDKLYHLINLAKKENLLDYNYHDSANRIRMSANKILHPRGKSSKTASAEKGAFEIILNTIKVIEHLYK